MSTWLMFLSTLSCALARALGITFRRVRLLVFLSQIPNVWFQVLQAFFKDSLKPSQAHGCGGGVCACNSSPDQSAVGLVVSQDGQAGRQLQSPAAISGDNSPLPPSQVNFVIFSSSKRSHWGLFDHQNYAGLAEGLKCRGPRKYALTDSRGCRIRPPPQPQTPPPVGFTRCLEVPPSPGPVFRCLSTPQ